MAKIQNRSLTLGIHLSCFNFEEGREYTYNVIFINLNFEVNERDDYAFDPM
jgi:hypothetical protein